MEQQLVNFNRNINKINITIDKIKKGCKIVGIVVLVLKKLKVNEEVL